METGLFRTPFLSPATSHLALPQLPCNPRSQVGRWLRRFRQNLAYSEVSVPATPAHMRAAGPLTGDYGRPNGSGRSGWSFRVLSDRTPMPAGAELIGMSTPPTAVLRSAPLRHRGYGQGDYLRQLSSYPPAQQ